MCVRLLTSSFTYCSLTGRWSEHCLFLFCFFLLLLGCDLKAFSQEQSVEHDTAAAVDVSFSKALHLHPVQWSVSVMEDVGEKE